MYEDDPKDEFCFRWKLKNFSFAPNKTGEEVKSPSFTAHVLDETKWFIEVYPRGKENEENVDIFVRRLNSDYGGVEIRIKFTIELEASDSSLQERAKSVQTIFKRGSCWGFQGYIKRATLLEDMKSTFLPDDTLTILCKLERVCQHTKEYIIESFNESVELQFDWAVPKWSEFSEIYHDAEFTGENTASFRIFICRSDDSERKLILKLQKLKPEEKNAYVKCCMSVLNTPGFEALARTSWHHFSNGSNMTCRDLFDRDEIQDYYVQDDVLSLRCILNMETGRKIINNSEIHASPADDLENYAKKELINDFKNMFLTGDSCNVKIRAGDKIVECHESLLCCRSAVMRHLLTNAKRSSEKYVTIDIYDIDGDTLEQMIYFIYSDQIDNITYPRALKLFVAAHNYQIKYLKQKCSLYLATVFNFENVYDILFAAHVHEDWDLKRSTISYISEYYSRICLTLEWENFRKTKKELAAYTCSEIRRIKNM